MITDETRQKLWEEIKRSQIRRTPIRPDERTKEQLKEFFGVGNGQIKTIIEQLVKEGKMTSRPALSNGKACTAYSVVSEELNQDTEYCPDYESETADID